MLGVFYVLLALVVAAALAPSLGDAVSRLRAEFLAPDTGSAAPVMPYRTMIYACSAVAVWLAISAPTDSQLLAQPTAGGSVAPGPFGLSMGMSEKELRSMVKLDSVKGSRGLYEAKSVPNPSSAFESYRLTVSPKQGLCKITAYGITITTSVYGSELKSQFEKIEGLLTEKYGKHKTYDFFNAGSIWNEPRDWMMGLRKKERNLAAAWDSEEGSTLPPSIAAVWLDANALSTESGWLFVSFEAKTYNACKKELETNPF